MRNQILLLGLWICGTVAAGTPDFVCENGRYRLEIDSSSKEARVIHKKRPETFFEATHFKKTGTKVVRYSIKGEAHALRYEGTAYERWYRGEAVIRTSARLVDQDIVHSAEFLIDYDPYYAVTTWDGCVVR